MAQTNSEKQELLRQRRAKLGLLRKEFYLSPAEFKKVQKYIASLRK